MTSWRLIHRGATGSVPEKGQFPEQLEIPEESLEDSPGPRPPSRRYDGVININFIFNPINLEFSNDTRLRML